MTGGEDNRHRPTGKTSLMVACEQGRTLEVKIILQKKPLAVASRDRNGKTALHYCAESGSLPCAQLVVAADPNLLHVHDNDGFTPLHLSIIAGNRSVAKLFLKYGADPDRVDKERHSTVHWASVCGDIESLEMLLNNGANPSLPDILGAYPIHYAAQMCGTHSLNGKDPETGINTLKKLVQRGASVQCRDRDGREPLLWAASSGSNEAVLILFTAGASIETTDKDGLTALHCAASRGHTSCVETLVTLCGSRVNTGDTIGCSPLFYAAAQGHADSMQVLLKYSADPNLQDNKGRTPAHCAAAKGQLEIMKILDSNGADLWIRNSRGNLPLHEAVQSGRKDLVQWLLQQCPKAVNATNINGRTPLHIASQKNNVEMCEVLIDYGAHINPLMVNAKGFLMSPLDVSVYQGNQRCAKYLQLHGAVPATKVLENNEINRNLLFSLGNFAYNQKERSDEEPVSAASFDHKSFLLKQDSRSSIPRDTQTRTIRAGQPLPLQPDVPDESLLTNVTSGEVTDASVHIHLTRDDLWSLWESLMQELTSEMSGSEMSSEGRRKRRSSSEVRQLKPILTNVYLRRTSSKEIAGESILDRPTRDGRSRTDDDGTRRKVKKPSRKAREDLTKKPLPKVYETEMMANQDIEDQESSYVSDIDRDDPVEPNYFSDSVGSDTEVTRDAVTGVKVTRLRKRRSDARTWEPDESETSSGHRPEQRESNPYLKRYFQKQAKVRDHVAKSHAEEDDENEHQRSSNRSDKYKHVVREDYDAFHKKQRKKEHTEKISEEQPGKERKSRKKSGKEEWHSTDNSIDVDNMQEERKDIDQNNKSGRRHSRSSSRHEKHSKSRHRRPSQSQDERCQQKEARYRRKNSIYVDKEERSNEMTFDEDSPSRHLMRRKSSSQFLEVPLQTTSNLVSSEREEAFEEIDDKSKHQHHHHHHHHRHRPSLEKDLSAQEDFHHFAQHRKNRRHFHRKRSRLRRHSESMGYSSERRPLSDDDSRFYRSDHLHSSLEEQRSKSEMSVLTRRNSEEIPRITIFDEELKSERVLSADDDETAESICTKTNQGVIDNQWTESVDGKTNETDKSLAVPVRDQASNIKDYKSKSELAVNDVPGKEIVLGKKEFDGPEKVDITKRRASRTRFLSSKSKSGTQRIPSRSTSRSTKKTIAKPCPKITKPALSPRKLKSKKEKHTAALKKAADANEKLPDIIIVPVEGETKQESQDEKHEKNFPQLQNAEDEENAFDKSLKEDEIREADQINNESKINEPTRSKSESVQLQPAAEVRDDQKIEESGTTRDTNDNEKMTDHDVKLQTQDLHEVETATSAKHVDQNKELNSKVFESEESQQKTDQEKTETLRDHLKNNETLNYKPTESDSNKQNIPADLEFDSKPEIKTTENISKNKESSVEGQKADRSEEEEEKYESKEEKGERPVERKKLNEEKEELLEERKEDKGNKKQQLKERKTYKVVNRETESTAVEKKDEIKNQEESFLEMQSNRAENEKVTIPSQQNEEIKKSGENKMNLKDSAQDNTSENLRKKPDERQRMLPKSIEPKLTDDHPEDFDPNMQSDDQDTKSNYDKNLNLEDHSNEIHTHRRLIKGDKDLNNLSEYEIEPPDEEKPGEQFFEPESSSEAETKFFSDESDEIQPEPDLLLLSEELSVKKHTAEDKEQNVTNMDPINTNTTKSPNTINLRNGTDPQDVITPQDGKKRYPITAQRSILKDSNADNCIKNNEEKENSIADSSTGNDTRQTDPAYPTTVKESLISTEPNSEQDMLILSQKDIIKDKLSDKCYKSPVASASIIEGERVKSQTQLQKYVENAEQPAENREEIICNGEEEQNQNSFEAELCRSISVQTGRSVSSLDNREVEHNVQQSTIAIQTETSREAITLDVPKTSSIGTGCKKTLDIGTSTKDILSKDTPKDNETKSSPKKSPERHNPSAVFYHTKRVDSNIPIDKQTKEDNKQKQNRGALFYTTPGIAAKDNMQPKSTQLISNRTEQSHKQQSGTRFRSRERERSLESERAVAIANSAFRKLNSSGQLTVFNSTIINPTSDSSIHFPNSQHDSPNRLSCQRHGEYSNLDKPGFLWVHFGSGSSPIHTLRRKPNFSSQRIKHEKLPDKEQKNKTQNGPSQTNKQTRRIQPSANARVDTKEMKQQSGKTTSISESSPALQVKSKVLNTKSVQKHKDQAKVDASKKLISRKDSKELEKRIDSQTQSPHKQNSIQDIQSKPSKDATISPRSKKTPEKNKQVKEEKNTEPKGETIPSQSCQTLQPDMSIPNTTKNREKSVKHQSKSPSGTSTGRKDTKEEKHQKKELNIASRECSAGSEDVTRDDDGKDDDKRQAPRLSETAKSSSLDEGDVKFVIERKEDPGISIKIRMKDRNKDKIKRDCTTDFSSAPGESDQKDSGYISTTESIHKHRRSITIDLGHTTAMINAGMKGSKSHCSEQKLSLPSLENDENVNAIHPENQFKQRKLSSKLPVLETARRKSNSSVFSDYTRSPRRDSLTTSELSVKSDGSVSLCPNIQSPRRENVVKSALQVPGDATTLGNDFKRQTSNSSGRANARRSSIPIFRAHSDGHLHKDYKPSPRLGTSRHKSLSTPSINETEHIITPRSGRQMFIIKESGSSTSDLRHSDSEIAPKSAEKLTLPSIRLYEPEDDYFTKDSLEDKFPSISTPHKMSPLPKSRGSSRTSNPRNLPLLQRPMKCRCNIQPYKGWEGRRTRSAVDCVANVHFLTEEEVEEFDARFHSVGGRTSKVRSSNNRYRALRTQTLKRRRSGRPSRQAVTFHVDHEKERNTFRLPTESLREDKKWQVTFTIGKTKGDKENKDADSKS